MITVIVAKLNSCNIPVSFMETTRLLAARAARQGLCSHACVLRRGEPLVQASACLVAVRSALGAVPPPPARAWSVLTDSHRPTSGREGQKGAFRATYARFAGEHRDTKFRVAVRATAGEHPRPFSRARSEASLTATQASGVVSRPRKAGLL